MLWKDLKIALRSLRRDPLYAAINITGLAVGVACCFLLGLYVRSELSYDDFHAGADRIVRVTAEMEPGEPPTGHVPPPLPQRVQSAVPGVESAVGWWSTSTILRVGDTSINEVVYLADASFFEVFSFPLLQGNAATALDGPNKVVLTRSAAERHFGTTDAVGRSVKLRIDGAFETFQVSAVAEDPPPTSSLQFDVVGPFARMASIRGSDYAENWGNFSTSAFLRLAPGADRSQVEQQINDVIRPILAETFAGAPFEPPALRLQALTAIHLTPDVRGRGVQPPSSPMYAYVLGGLALLILIVACLNFANLSVGRSLRRSTEIGVRKALGAHRSQLARQFLAEALLASGIGAALGALLAAVALPAFNTLVGKSLSLPPGDAPALAGGFVGLLLLTTLLAGSYPAFVLSRFDPSATLRHRARFGVSGGMAKGMVIVQFALAVLLVASGFVMRAQMQHVQNQDLGYEPADLVTVALGRGDGEQVLDRLRQQLAGLSSIEHLAATDAGLSRTNVTAEDAQFTSAYRWATPDLLETQRLRLLQGRFLSDNRPADLDGNTVVVNEAFVREAGLDAPLGTQVEIEDDWVASIVGVVADFHYRSLHAPVNPMMLHHANDDPQRLWVRMRSGATSEGLRALETAWRATAPLLPFDYAFESQRIEQQYRADRRWLQIVGVAAGLALFVALLGLIGLATLTVAERKKEIGVRKALGATATQVVLLLSGSVARLVGAAFVVGAPVAYLATRPWIESFAVQAATQPALYGAAGLAILTVALAAVSLQAYRATRIDPATTLRKE
jgi:putative ABC transport system permease protein